MFAIFASGIISSLKLDSIESYLFDIRVRAKALLGLSIPINSPIVIVKIDSSTIEKFNGFPNFANHAQFLNQLKKTKPQFVVYDFKTKDGHFKDINGSEAEQKLFLHSANSIDNFYIAAEKVKMKPELSLLKLKPPLDSLEVFQTEKCPDLYLFAKDGVNRRMMITYQEQILLHPYLASFYNPEILDTRKIRGLFNLFDSEQSYINFNEKGSFPIYRFEDIVNGNFKIADLVNKIIIVGNDTGKSLEEYVLTPYSREINAMTSMELHANAVQTLIENSGPLRLPNWINILVTSLISILTVHVVLSLKPSHGLLLLGSTLIGIAILALILFLAFKIWMTLAHPFLAIFLCYYFFIPYRLIIENRKSWEYFQKNKLLQQVEELKTNFISMMSHDLKTPIARIQGMTEVILQEVTPLSSTQREAVDTIKSSSDDLLKFINSILQYGRIESQGIELHKQSKDINQLIKDVVKKHEFLAQVKKIKIIQNLEPLFPLTIDPELMKQVLSNLIENAIKYSFENSKITINSKEINDIVVIEVIDTGMGIPSIDLPNVFMKFFRSHNVKTSTIKGTGLGLYLASYFIQLHKGQIFAESEPGKGSKFIIHIPLSS